MSKTAAISKLGKNNFNTPSSDDNDVYGSVERGSEPLDGLRGGEDTTLGEFVNDEEHMQYFNKDGNIEN